jgi:hypothetical protein
VLVLEGKARSASIPPAQGVSVVRAPGSGDDAIASLAGPGDVVVTADRELRRRVEAAGAVAEGPGWLLRQLALLSWRQEVRYYRAGNKSMYVVAIVLIVVLVCLMFALDRGLKAVERGRRRRENAERLAAVAAEAEEKERKRQEAASASKALTSVFPAIFDRGPRKVA